MRVGKESGAEKRDDGTTHPAGHLATPNDPPCREFFMFMREAISVWGLVVMLLGFLSQASLLAEPVTPWPEMPDPEIATAYQRAAVQNVLAAVNPKVFPGYWSVCADGQGFGYGNL
jgi:hypothetical protein